VRMISESFGIGGRPCPEAAETQRNKRGTRSSFAIGDNDIVLRFAGLFR